MIFIDTNYFLRLLLKENQKQHLLAKTLFQKAAAGKIKTLTSLLVIFEIYWVISSFYQKDKKKVCQILDQILDMTFIFLPSRNILKKALFLYQNSGLDLEDSYNLFYSQEQQASDFLTFDQKLKKTWAQIKIS